MNLKLTRPLCFFDIESTGVDVAIDRIISLAILKVYPADDLIEGFEERFKCICNPGVFISKENSDIHGFTNESVKDLPTFKHFAIQIQAFLNGCDLAGYNCLNFDVPLLHEEFACCGIQLDLRGVAIIDAGNIFKKKEQRTLAAACTFYNVPILENAHEAMADVVATRDVLGGQVARYPDLQTLSVAELAKFSAMEDRIDLCGKITRNAQGEPVYNFGKSKGTRVVDDTGFGVWMLQKDFTANTKAVVRAILKGELK